MSITDELREYFGKSKGMFTDHVLAIADRIDAEHERLMEERADRYAELRASLKERYVELPKDADGEYVHFGDVMEWRHPCGSCELRHGIVTGIKTDKIGDEVFHEVTINADRFAVRLMASELRHHHVPTVEDVVREMLYRAHIYDKREMELLPDLIAEYAAKLRLVEGEDA